MVNICPLLFSGFCIAFMFSKGQAKYHKLSGDQVDTASPILHVYNNDARLESDAYRGERRKKAVTQTAKGLAVLQALLRGAKEIPTKSNRYRLYKKYGNLDTALKDFNSVKPDFTGPKRYGWNSQGLKIFKPRIKIVGDRKLILMPDGDRYSRRSPVLQIWTDTDVLYDRIVYKIEK